MRITFAGWPGCDGPAAARAPIAILGAPHATPYRRGEPSHSAAAPTVLRAALTGYARSREQFDFDLDALPPTDVEDCGDVSGDPADPEGNRDRITAAVRTVLDKGAVPVVLGGDDSVPIPMFRAFEGPGPLTVVQVDAHLDWRDEVHGERYGWSSPMRRVSELPWIRHMIQVGLRGVGSARASDVADARAWGVGIVPAEEVHRAGVARAIGLVPEGVPCLVTVDCDGLDPSIMPAVQAPAPGGLAYWHVVELIRGVARRAPIAGFDLVEFMPARDVHGLAARTAARIVCNAIAAIAGAGHRVSRDAAGAR
jgi:agmatinase